MPEKELMLQSNCCPFCSSEQGNAIITARDYEYKTVSNFFTYYQCNQFSLTYLHPRPKVEDISKTYPHNYEQYSHEMFGITLKKSDSIFENNNNHFSKNARIA
jgi:hypothetical protein